jgi:hypothetical protein
MKNMNLAFLGLMLAILMFGCNKSNPIGEKENSIYEVIEHSAIHMVSGPVLSVKASDSLPGTHIEPDSMEHHRLDIALTNTDTLKGGYVHFGPDVTGDLLIMTNVPARIRLVNRNVVGDSAVDTSLEIEERFSAKEITDSAGVTSIVQALLFEAKTGANILCIDSVSFDTLKLVIEEAEHDHH